MKIEWKDTSGYGTAFEARVGVALLRVELQPVAIKWIASCDLVGLTVSWPLETLAEAEAWAIKAACEKVQPLIDQARAEGTAKERAECAALARRRMMLTVTNKADAIAREEAMLIANLIDDRATADKSPEELSRTIYHGAPWSESDGKTGAK